MINQLEQLNGWCKYLQDGTFIKGDDPSTEANQVSWTKTSQDIKTLSVFHTNSKKHPLIGTITGPGEFWQSEDYIAQMNFLNSSRSIKIRRRIQRLISIQDKQLLVEVLPNKVNCSFLSKDYPPIPSNWYNKWLTIEIEIPTNTISWYLSDTKI